MITIWFLRCRDMRLAVKVTSVLSGFFHCVFCNSFIFNIAYICQLMDLINLLRHVNMFWEVYH